jgi:hypothetical protein
MIAGVSGTHPDEPDMRISAAYPPRSRSFSARFTQCVSPRIRRVSAPFPQELHTIFSNDFRRGGVRIFRSFFAAIPELLGPENGRKRSGDPKSAENAGLAIRSAQRVDVFREVAR